MSAASHNEDATADDIAEMARARARGDRGRRGRLLVVALAEPQGPRRRVRARHLRRRRRADRARAGGRRRRRRSLRGRAAGRDRGRRRPDARRGRAAAARCRRPPTCRCRSSSCSHASIPTCGAASSSWCDKANADGAHVIAQVAARPGGMLIGAASYHPLVRRPTYRRLEDSLSLDELLVELRKPEVKAAILAEDDLPARPAPPVRVARRQRPVPAGAASSRSATRPTTSPRREQSIAGVAAADRPRPVRGLLRPPRRR